MPRPKKCRWVGAAPGVISFKPRGVPMHQLEEVYLSLDGFDALRLSDLEGLSNSEAAERMGVSRHTFGRVLAAARRTVAHALIEGLALRIEGGTYRLRDAETELVRPAAPQWEPTMTKIAISATGPSLDDPLDPRFGRAAGFLIVDVDTGESVYISNAGADGMAGGAGIQAVQVIANAGAKALLTGRVGPKAANALAAAGVAVVQDMDGGTVRQAVDRFVAGGPQAADTPDPEAVG